jgi:hypothetical protein
MATMGWMKIDLNLSVKLPLIWASAPSDKSPQQPDPGSRVLAQVRAVGAIDAARTGSHVTDPSRCWVPGGQQGPQPPPNPRHRTPPASAASFPSFRLPSILLLLHTYPIFYFPPAPLLKQTNNGPPHTRVPSGPQFQPLAPVRGHGAVHDHARRTSRQHDGRQGPQARGLHQALRRVHDREPHRLPCRRLLQAEAAQGRLQGGG